MTNPCNTLVLFIILTASHVSAQIPIDSSNEISIRYFQSHD
jgi:hypothetical protein